MEIWVDIYIYIRVQDYECKVFKELQAIIQKTYSFIPCHKVNKFIIFEVWFVNIYVQISQSANHLHYYQFVFCEILLHFKSVPNLDTVYQIKWLLKLSQIPQVTEVPSFSEEAQSYLQGVIDDFSMNDALEIKNIERVTNHDVKAVEYFLKQKCQSHPEIAKVGIYSLFPLYVAILSFPFDLNSFQ